MKNSSVIAVVIAVFAQLRLYDLRNLASGEEVRRLILGISAVIVGIPTILLWIHRGGFSRAWVGVTWAFSVGLVLLSRRLWHVAVRRARARGKLTFRTLVVGTSVQSYGPGCLEEDAVVTHAGRVPGPLATRADPLPQLNNRLFRMFRSVC